MKHSAFSFLPASLALAIATSPAFADSQNSYQLDQVVVSATRTAQTVEQALAPVSVITREDIERSQASTVPELLRSVPGVQFTANGGRGATTSMMIRGASSSQTVVLVDGQRINSATNGSPELQFLDPRLIERIEVVRGPVSGLYGADAIGGVVHIFTRKGRGEPHFSARAGIGSDNTHEPGFNAGGKSGNTRFDIGAFFAETDGFDFTNDLNSGHKGVNLDDDSYRNSSFSGSLSQQFSNGAEAGLSVTHARGTLNYDATTGVNPNPATGWYGSYEPYRAYTKFNNTTFNGYISKAPNDIWFTRLDAGYVRNNSKNLGDQLPAGNEYKSSEFETIRSSLLWQNDINWQENQLLTVGVDYYRDQVDGTSDYTNPYTNQREDSRYNIALFVQNQTQFENSDMQLALRQDKNETYGSNTTGNIAYGYGLSDTIRIIGSYGKAFRAPTFNDLYYPDTGDGGSVGNPDVKPESSQNFELAVKASKSFGQWQVAAFQNDIDDMIAWAKDPVLNRSKPSNISKARIRGLEASIQTSLMGWDIYSALTLLDPKDRKTDTYLARRARQNFYLNADRQLGSWSVGGTMNARGESYDSAGNKNRLAGFATFDFRLAKQLNKQFKSELKLTNLLDKEYSTVKGYNAPPFAGIVSMIWTPEL